MSASTPQPSTDEREELVDILDGHVCGRCYDPTPHAADAILAAGFHRTPAPPTAQQVAEIITRTSAITGGSINLDALSRLIEALSTPAPSDEVMSELATFASKTPYTVTRLAESLVSLWRQGIDPVSLMKIAGRVDSPSDEEEGFWPRLSDDTWRDINEHIARLLVHETAIEHWDDMPDSERETFRPKHLSGYDYQGIQAYADSCVRAAITAMGATS